MKLSFRWSVTAGRHQIKSITNSLTINNNYYIIIIELFVLSIDIQKLIIIIYSTLW